MMSEKLAQYIRDYLCEEWNRKWINETFGHIVSTDNILKAIDAYEGGAR